MRLVLLTAVLSRVSVPPLLMVTPPLPVVVVETEASAGAALAVRVEALTVISGWGVAPRVVPRNVTRKTWLLAPLVAVATTVTLEEPTPASAPRALWMAEAVVPG